MPSRFRSSTNAACETSLRVAAQCASARSWRRASSPRTRRKGSGNSGNRSIGGKGAKTTCRADPLPSSQSASAARCRVARLRRGWSTTSLTPLMTTATSPGGGGAAMSKSCTPRVVRPDFARRLQRIERWRRRSSARTRWPATALVLMRDADAGGRRVAGDEHPDRQVVACTGATVARARCLGQDERAPARADRLHDKPGRERQLVRERGRRMAKRPHAVRTSRSRAFASGRRH